LAKPASSQVVPRGSTRNAPYLFIASRPEDKVRHEVSIMFGYALASSTAATVAVGSDAFDMYAKDDGAWLKNIAEEARIIDTMRKGATLVAKGSSARGVYTTDRYSLKGLAQALDRAIQECR
jgi:hypothetical protein